MSWTSTAARVPRTPVAAVRKARLVPVCTPLCKTRGAGVQVLKTLSTRDTRSLCARLNYPPSAPGPSNNHLENRFADPFLTVWSVAAKRTPLEFLEDTAPGPIAVIRKALNSTLRTPRRGDTDPAGDDIEVNTLLSHPAKLTDGMQRVRLFARVPYASKIPGSSATECSTLLFVGGIPCVQPVPLVQV